MTFERPIDVATSMDGGGMNTPADRIRRLCSSPWAAALVRALGVLGVMIALAVIGVVSMSKSFVGTNIPPNALGAQLGGSWIAPDKSPPSTNPAVPPASGGGAHEQCDRSDAGAPSQGLTADGKVILNAAAVADLTRLPGVGRQRAEAIITLRTRLKKFRRITDLLRVKGIGARSLRRMQPHIVLDPPAVPAGSDGGIRGDGG